MAYKLIPGFPKYTMNELGQVRNAKHETPVYHNGKTVQLYKDGGVRETIVVPAMVKELHGATATPTDIAEVPKVNLIKKVVTTKAKVIAPKPKVKKVTAKRVKAKTKPVAEKEKLKEYTDAELKKIAEIKKLDVSGAEKIRRYYHVNTDKYNTCRCVADLKISYDRVYGCIDKYVNDKFKTIKLK